MGDGKVVDFAAFGGGGRTAGLDNKLVTSGKQQNPVVTKPSGREIQAASLKAAMLPT
jgi:hypothetical protein